MSDIPTPAAPAAPAAPDAGWNFDNTFAQLPDSLFVSMHPIPVRKPRLVLLNRPLCHDLGLSPEALGGEAGARILSGNIVPQGAHPLAQAYAGHQFGHFTMLGDGRAIVLGEQLTPSGKRFDIQLKGSGRTPFSRGGDGRAALGPMLREYLISEAMHALGVPTTRSLAVTTTGDAVERETLLDGAVLTRVSSSHLRFGTFEYLAALKDEDALRTLADYAIHRHYPQLAGQEHPYLALLEAVMHRHARLVASWLNIGFVHGVMNTDNMALSAETIDYGPCAFMDRYDPATVFSSIDHGGRYAYGNQPEMARWNLARFAEALLPLIHDNHEQGVELATDVLDQFPTTFSEAWLTGMRAKLGLADQEPDDLALARDLLECMHAQRADFTNSFRALAENERLSGPLFSSDRFIAWEERWHARTMRQPDPAQAGPLMCSSNPAYIPRNHRVEEALAAAVEDHDLSVVRKLLEVLSEPYRPHPEHRAYRQAPDPAAPPYRTFCGT